MTLVVISDLINQQLRFEGQFGLSIWIILAS